MSAHTEAHKRRRDAAYERGYAACREDAAKIADAAHIEAGENEQLGDDEWWTRSAANGQAAVIARNIRNLRSAG